MLKKDIVEKYLRKYSDENNQLTMPKQTLARLIYNENHGLFPNVQAARSMKGIDRGEGCRLASYPRICAEIYNRRRDAKTETLHEAAGIQGHDFEAGRVGCNVRCSLPGT